MDWSTGTAYIKTAPLIQYISLKYMCKILIITKNKSNTECGIIRPTNAIYMGSQSLLGSKALSKCEVNLTSGFQATAFTSNILHRVQC